MSDFFDENLLNEFVTESREHLDAIEPDLLVMERDLANVSGEIINRVFRAIHSMKGGAGFLSFEALKNLSHIMESVLMPVRDGKIAITPPMVDALLSGVDKLRKMLADIHASDQVPIQDDVARFEAFLSGGHAENHTAAPDAPPKPRDDPNAPYDALYDLQGEDMRQALAQGMYIYNIKVNPLEDIMAKGLTLDGFKAQCEAFGVWIAANGLPEPSFSSGGDEIFNVLFGTVLEPDLAMSAFELPADQIVVLDREALKQRIKDGQRQSATSGPTISTEAASPREEATPQAAGRAKGPDRAEVETLRVRVDLLTRLMNIAGELVLGRNQLLSVLDKHTGAIPGLAGILQNVDLVTSELQESIMQTRMQPIGVVLSRFPRVVRDMARNLGKEIDLTVEGQEVELDKSIVELLSDPLTHLVRNCADHALEPPNERLAGGKSRQGRIILRAFHEGGQVNIAVIDDGRGIDPKRIIQKAIEKGVVTRAAAEDMSEKDIVNLIFAPGFSTAEVVSDVSGRGVGMDVVRTNVEKLGGHIEVESKPGEGTSVLLRLPLTLAIIPSLIVGAGGLRFAVPQVNLVELVWVRAGEVGKRVETVHGSAVLRLRGRLLPLVRLSDVLGIQSVFVDTMTGEQKPDRRQTIAERRQLSTASEAIKGKRHSEDDRRKDWRGDHNIVVLKVGSNQFGLIVDELFDSEEIVVKPLSSYLKNCNCFAGATIMGDGRVIMILDAGGVASRSDLSFSDLEAEEKRRREEDARREAEAAAARRSVIFFNNHPSEFFAVPQEQVLRLERILPSDIELVGGGEFVQYRGSGLPLLRLERYIGVRPLPEDVGELFLIIPKSPHGSGESQVGAGILVSNIVDAMDVEVKLQPANVSGPGLDGSAVVQNRLTLFLNPYDLLKAAGYVGGA